MERWAGTLGMFAAELITPGTRGGGEIEKRFNCLCKGLDDQDLNGRCKDVGVVASEKDVAITEDG